MPNTWITDLTHFATEEGTLVATGPAARVAGFMARVVEAATVRPAGALHRTAIPCRSGPRPGRCPGHLEAGLVAEGEVEWRCPTCGKDGVIRGWERSPYDLRAGAGDVRGTEISVRLAADSYEGLFRADRPWESAGLIAAAVPDGDDVVLQGRRDEAERFRDELRIEVEDEQRPPQRRRLRAVLAEVGRALAPSEECGFDQAKALAAEARAALSAASPGDTGLVLALLSSVRDLADVEPAAGADACADLLRALCDAPAAVTREAASEVARTALEIGRASLRVRNVLVPLTSLYTSDTRFAAMGEHLALFPYAAAERKFLIRELERRQAARSGEGAPGALEALLARLRQN
jgi:hypothetical protein